MEEKHSFEYPNISRTASATECTGLMYRPPVDMEEYEAYQEVYGMEFPETD